MSARRREETQRLLTEISRKKDRFILVGDFNAEPGSAVIREVSRVLRHAGPSYDLPTWTTKPFVYDGFTATELRWRLDYVFVTPDVGVTRAEILTSPFSDHLPILCEVDVR
jgi:endonuclease/exonuclease/phosphatase family metal-dependent hydrolase